MSSKDDIPFKKGWLQVRLCTRKQDIYIHRAYQTVLDDTGLELQEKIEVMVHFMVESRGVVAYRASGNFLVGPLKLFMWDFSSL